MRVTVKMFTCCLRGQSQGPRRGLHDTLTFLFCLRAKHRAGRTGACQPLTGTREPSACRRRAGGSCAHARGAGHGRGRDSSAPPPAVHGPEAHTATCLPLPWKASCGQSGRDRPEFILTTCPPPAPARPPWLPGPFRPRPRLPGGGPLLRAPLENPGGVLVSTVRPREATAVVHSAELVPTSFLNVPVGSRTCSLRTPPTRAPPATSARGGAMARRPAQLLAGDSAFGRRGARREAGLRPANGQAAGIS